MALSTQTATDDQTPPHGEPAKKARPAKKMVLTREGLAGAMTPPNTCQIASFRVTLDPDSQAIFDEAVAYKGVDLSAQQLRTWLLGAGFPEHDVPSINHIVAHRATRKPCRCRG